MKRIQKTSAVFIAFLIFFFIGLNFIYNQITPRMLGQAIFPLEKISEYCVGEKIQGISAGDNNLLLVRTNSTLRAYNVETGILIWEVSIKKQVMPFPPKSVGNKVFASDDEYLWAFNLHTGELLWKTLLEGDSPWIPDVSERYALINPVSGNIDVYETESGTKIWSVPGGRGYTPAFIDHDKVYIVDRAIKALDANDGRPLWQINMNRSTGLGTFSSGILTYIEYPQDQTFDLVAYDTVKNRELWRINFSDIKPTSLVIQEGFLFLEELNGLYQIDIENGMINWRKEFSSPENLSFIDGKIYVLEQFHRVVHALNITNGEEVESLQISLPHVISDQAQRMVPVGKYLVFSRGCEFFVYGN